MSLNLDQKKDLVKEVADVVANADTLLTADFRGLTANELGEFRKIARNPGIYIKVVKNNMHYYKITAQELQLFPL